MRYPILAFVLLTGAATAGSLKSLRQIPLSDYIRATGEPPRVSALAFSPDEQWIAAAIDQGRDSRLVVLSRDRRPDSLRYSANLPPPSTASPQIAWSPDGNALLVESNPPVLVDLQRETTCTLDPARDTRIGGFPSTENVVVALRSRLILYDRTCRPVHYRDLEAPVITLAVSPERGTIAVATDDNKLTLYEAASGKALKTWRRPPRPQIGFLSSGDLLCEAARPARERVTPECWSTTDDSTSEAPSVEAGAPFSPAARAPLAAFTDGKYSYDAFFDTGKSGIRRGVIWNLARGSAVATWKPAQEGCGLFDDPWTGCRTPAVFALSPEGRYFADVRNGQLRIQQVVP